MTVKWLVLWFLPSSSPIGTAITEITANRTEWRGRNSINIISASQAKGERKGKDSEGKLNRFTLIDSSNSCRFPWTFFDHSNLLELFFIVKLKKLFTDDHAYDPGCTGSELLGIVYLYHVNDRRFCVSVFLFLVGLSESWIMAAIVGGGNFVETVKLEKRKTSLATDVFVGIWGA